MTLDDKDNLSPHARVRQQQGLSIEGLGFTKDPDDDVPQTYLDLISDGVMAVLKQRVQDQKAGVDHDLE